MSSERGTSSERSDNNFHDADQQQQVDLTKYTVRLYQGGNGVSHHQYGEDGNHNDVDGVVLGVIVPAVGLVGQLHGEDPDQGDH